jgi:hypothetical protein
MKAVNNFIGKPNKGINGINRVPQFFAKKINAERKACTIMPGSNFTALF